MNFFEAQGILIVANLAIATFTLIYGSVFLVKTVQHEHRKTWNFMVLAIGVYLTFQLSKMLKVFGVAETDLVSVILEIIFNGLLLFVFIFQQDLIEKYDFIKIEKKAHHKNKKKIIKKKAGKKNGK